MKQHFSLKIALQSDKICGKIINITVFFGVIMKNIKEFVSKASVYTVLILSIFYIYGGISSLSQNGIHWTRFLIIAGYSCLIAGVDIFNRQLPIKNVFKTLIHYTVLLVGFVVVFFTAGTAEIKPATFFIAFVLFSVTYLAVSLISLGVKKLWNKLPSDKSEPTADKPKKKEYHSLYGDK